MMRWSSLSLAYSARTPRVSTPSSDLGATIYTILVERILRLGALAIRTAHSLVAERTAPTNGCPTGRAPAAATTTSQHHQARRAWYSAQARTSVTGGTQRP